MDGLDEDVALVVLHSFSGGLLDGDPSAGTVAVRDGQVARKRAYVDPAEVPAAADGSG